MKTLFKIQQEYAELAYSLIENGGELTPELETALQINRDELESKAEGYGMVINQIDAECTMINNEIDRLQGLIDSRKKAIDKLKSRLSDALTSHGIDKVKSNFINISFRKTESVEITDESLIPEGFMRKSVSMTPNKTALKDAIKNGELIMGARIVVKNNIQIK